MKTRRFKGYTQQGTIWVVFGKIPSKTHENYGKFKKIFVPVTKAVYK